MDSGYLWVTAERRGESIVLTVSGDLDVNSAEDFAGHVATAMNGLTGPVTVDLSALAFVDCHGARILAGVLNGLPVAGPLALSPLRPMVRRVLSLSGVRLRYPPIQAGGAPKRQISELRGRLATTLARSHEAMCRGSVAMQRRHEAIGRLAETFELMATMRTGLAESRPHEAEYWLARSQAASQRAQRYRQLLAKAA